MSKKWKWALIVFVVVLVISPFCFCLVCMESFLSTANPKQRPSQVVKDWFQGN